MRAIVPIKELTRRMPVQGRIRLGEKGEKGQPQKLNKFRFTSHDQEAVAEIANLYGGTPRPWAKGPRAGEWEVKTEAKSIHIALPPDPLGDSPIYEFWSGGGCQRRCDGVDCETQATTPDGGEKVEVPCMCTAQGAMVCKPKTRLSVILRSVRFGGVWRLDSGGWNTAHEMPGMVDTVMSLQSRGIVRGLLTLAERSSVSNGKTKKFVVPALALDQDVEALAAGAAAIGSLAPAPVPVLALAPADPDPDDSVDDDDASVVEAEIVDHPMKQVYDVFPDAEVQVSTKPGNPQVRLILLCKELAKEHYVDDKELRAALVTTLTAGAETSSTKLDDKQRAQGIGVLQDLLDGRRSWGGISDGRLSAPRRVVQEP